MSPEFQTLSALAVVAVAAIWLTLRALAKLLTPGGGHDCACPSKQALKKNV